MNYGTMGYHLHSRNFGDPLTKFFLQAIYDLLFKLRVLLHFIKYILWYGYIFGNAFSRTTKSVRFPISICNRHLTDIYI